MRSLRRPLGRCRIQHLLRRVQIALNGDPDEFLKHVSGVIHVGANHGQERDLYERHDLCVLWIEALPEAFEILRGTLEGYPRQIALQALVTDQDDAEYAFHVANNEGQSSSILDLKHHKDIWPHVSYERTVTLRSTTLDALVEARHIDATRYDALILDTQGSELLVLRGAARHLSRFRYIKTEVADFESYAGCCQLADIARFMTAHGFREYSRRRFAQRDQGGSYYDIVYERRI
jgi:FkbM family methyltransferase